MGNDKKVILTSEAERRRQMEEEERIVLHLDEGGKQLSVTAGYFETAMREILRVEGVPNEHDANARERIVARSLLMAEAASKVMLKKRGELTAEIVTELQVKDLPPHIKWASQRVGVELFPASPLLTAVAAAAEKTGH